MLVAKILSERRATDSEGDRLGRVLAAQITYEHGLLSHRLEIVPADAGLDYHRAVTFCRRWPLSYWCASFSRGERMESRRTRVQIGQADRPALRHFHSARYIGGLTHGFYRYPAATSPELVRELLLSYTDSDDLVLDPFMGGGTTVVEALAYGRRALGGDLNSLALFVTRAKTTPLTVGEWGEVFAWVRDRPLRSGIIPLEGGGTLKVPRTLHVPIARALTRARFLRSSRQETVVRCALLQTAQWALESSYLYPRDPDDRRNVSPSLDLLGDKLEAVVSQMRRGMEEFVSTTTEERIRGSQADGYASPIPGQG